MDRRKEEGERTGSQSQAQLYMSGWVYWVSSVLANQYLLLKTLHPEWLL